MIKRETKSSEIVTVSGGSEGSVSELNPHLPWPEVSRQCLK